MCDMFTSCDNYYYYLAVSFQGKHTYKDRKSLFLAVPCSHLLNLNTLDLFIPFLHTDYNV